MTTGYLATFAEGSPWDAGRGRVIPKYPWESVLAPVAQWMGVSWSQLPAIFANFGKFGSEYRNSMADLFN